MLAGDKTYTSKNGICTHHKNGRVTHHIYSPLEKKLLQLSKKDTTPRKYNRKPTPVKVSRISGLYKRLKKVVKG